MAKQQSFADKLGKSKKSDLMAIDPDTNKETKIINVRIVDSIVSPKGTVKFLDRNQRVYESSYKPYKP
ncbi:hypothetical protein BH10BAC5_BH10BAC5_26610 [soil metagenome]